VSTLLESALVYAARGWPVVPVHTIVDGRCSCSDPECGNRGPDGKMKGSPGKHPRTPHGLEDATTDPDVIRRLWAKWREHRDPQ
jgi:hypothetical protein